MKRVSAKLLILMALAMAGLAVVLSRPQPDAAPTPLTLPDGSVVRIVAVTCGTNHVVGSSLARLVARTPSQLRMVLTRVLGTRVAAQSSITTTTPKMIVWLDRSTNGATSLAGSSYFRACLADASGFLSGEEGQLYSWSANPLPLVFGVAPRRDARTTVSFFHHRADGSVTHCGKLTFANPLFAKHPQWQPEPLPVTKYVDDVEVTLEKLSTGHGNNTTHKTVKGGGCAVEFGTQRDDGWNNTVVLLRLRPLKNTNEVWRIAGEEVSDATGNKAGNGSLGWGGSEQNYFTFAPGLWPSESAWKIRCEIKRAEGFTPGEKFTFCEVPLGELGQTNRLGWTTNFNGITVTLEHFCRRAPHTNSSWSSDELSHARFTTSGLTNGLHVDLLAVRADTGTNLAAGSSSSSGSERSYEFRTVPLNARTADFTFAVQQSRWVEFTVKPEVGTARREYQPNGGM